MSSKRSSVASFGDDVAGLLKAFTEEATEIAGDVAKEAADYCRDEIEKNAGTYGYKEYAESWKVKKTKAKGQLVTYTVYTPTYYRLAHLLEHGHAKVLWGNRTGGRVSGRPHIRPAERDSEQFFVDELKGRLSK